MRGRLIYLLCIISTRIVARRGKDMISEAKRKIEAMALRMKYKPQRAKLVEKWQITEGGMRRFGQMHRPNQAAAKM